MQRYFQLPQQAVNFLAAKYGSPLLVLSLDQIEQNYKLLTDNLPGVKVYYAVKANPDERIVRKLAGLGACFDVASDGEMLALTSYGISPERMVYANPVKTPSGLAVAKQTGVHQFTFDSESEIGKMAAAVPGGTVLLRIRVDNPQALVDLNKKFGAHPQDALRLLNLAREQGLDVAGLCFHVGSQSTNVKAYLDALRISRRIFDQAAKEGFNLRILDIGGGFPIPSLSENVDVVFMLRQIHAAIQEYFAHTEIWAEPGRFICGTAVNLITRVIGTQVRNGQPWYFLDEGLYGTFSGVIFDHWDFELLTFKQDKKQPATIAGPSCDSLDIMFTDKLIEPLALDDLILVPNCGAYTSASATVFNGFSKTSTIVWEDVRGEIADGKHARATA
ncbi:MAG: type III PLP-dependent enzyme [Negativicutes bacterium]|nr:type III PLP-dependent enzyme [Negativicutes bacterium]